MDKAKVIKKHKLAVVAFDLLLTFFGRKTIPK
jgi:hypothetical protein